MFAKKELTRRRRWKRRVKAAASVAVALAAGTFLTCQRREAAPAKSGDAEPKHAPAREAGKPAPKDHVDKREHKKGMPVRDNLLE